MVLKRYRTALTIGVIAALSVVGTVLFSLTVARDKPRSPPSDCNSTSCRTGTSRPDDTGAVCRGFYDFVCSRHRHRRPLLHQHATLALSSRLNASLSSFPALTEAFLRGSCPGHYALLGLDLYRACMGKGVDWSEVVRLMERVGLAGWPVPPAAQPDKSPLDIAGLMDLRLGVFSLARLSLRRHYGRVVMQLDRTPLPLRLQQLSVPLRDMGSYVRVVEKTLGLLQPGADGYWGPAATAIVELEQALERTQPRDAFVYGPRLIRFGDLPRSRHWNWAEYVAIVRDDASLLTQPNLTVLVHEPEQLALATQVLSNASSDVLFNYLGYRVLLHLAPLLPSEAHFLLPLAPWADVAAPRLAGCLRLLAHVHPFALRFFAGLQQGQQYAPPIPGGRADELFAAAQRATAAVIEALPFRENGAGMRRGRTLLMARLEQGQTSLAARLPPPQGPALWPAKGGFLDALVEVLNVRHNAFWLATAPDDGLDSRHQVEPFSMRADYVDEPNVVYVSPALSLALQELEALGNVLVAAPLVDALLRAALPGEPQELLRTSPAQMRCLARRLGTSLYDGHMPDQLRELLHPSALLEVFERSKPPPELGRFSARQFFFVHWAMTLCDAPQLQKRLRRYKMVPTRTRVDVTLANHAAFHGAWTCPSGTAMHRSKACPPLTR
ncbi:hypothetical protein V5799_026452 [Amblyomma americanum]|uniref:Uncharacterized protein n=1 Tax=Amblyomma americanum TaxID=6943 RepID=A0AAQ4DII9_AMBAM